MHGRSPRRRVKVPRDCSRVARILHPADLEAGAEAIEIEPGNVAFAAEAEGIGQRSIVPTVPPPTAAPRNSDEANAAPSSYERLGEAPVNMVVECQPALDVRNWNRLRQLSQVDLRDSAAKSGTGTDRRGQSCCRRSL